jgi:hypothetical protein
MIRQYGENFIVMLTPEKIQRSAKQRIFREMVQGKINYTEYGNYFTDPKLFENLLIAAQDELNNNSILKYALTEFDFNHPGNNSVVLLKGKHTNLEYVYSVICNKLMMVKMDNYNIGYLSDLSTVLYSYRNQI